MGGPTGPGATQKAMAPESKRKEPNMRVNLKVLGLALVAALAMSAMTASAAQAIGEFEADAYPAVAKGNQEGPENYFEITSDATHKNGSQTICESAVYNATLSAPSNVLRVTPHYSGCNQTVRVNGCYFDFTTHGTDGSGNTTGTVDVVCPGETTIEVVGPFGICEVHIQGEETGVAKGKNQNLTGITFTNAVNGDVTVDVNITTQIHYTETDTAFCPFGSGSTTRTDGNFVSKVLMKGFKHAGTENHPTTAGTAAHPVLTYKAGVDTDISVK